MFYIRSMATVKEVVLEHHKREDNAWRVSTRVTHNLKALYVKTNHYSTKSQFERILP
jgi:hypothetical protein